jgi:hypothetical protein
MSVSVNYPYSDRLVGKPGDDMMELRLIGNIITAILVLLWILIYADFLF